MPNLAENITLVVQNIKRVSTLVGRNANTINIVAASKGQTAAAIREAYRAGVHHFGENYVQEALGKIEVLSDLDISWHFIGPIQSNKTATIARHFHWVHSVDRLRIAERLSRQRPPELPPLQVCLQVNVDGEASKSGVSPRQLPELAEAVCALPNLRLRGLMAIPRSRVNQKEQAIPLRELAQLLNKLKSRSPRLAGLDTLSMGMSEDLAAAVAEGATLVRVGTAIFGPRTAPSLNPAEPDNQEL